jgi:hypothetical protein
MLVISLTSDHKPYSTGMGSHPNLGEFDRPVYYICPEFLPTITFRVMIYKAKK